MYSHIVNGEVLDFKFKKLKTSDSGLIIYVFFIGHIRLGSIHKLGKSWCAVSVFPNDICPVRGFRTRLDAGELLLTLYELDKKKIASIAQ